MQVLLHRIPEKYLERLNEPDKGHIETALKGAKDDNSCFKKRMKDYEKDPTSFKPLKC